MHKPTRREFLRRQRKSRRPVASAPAATNLARGEPQTTSATKSLSQIDSLLRAAASTGEIPGIVALAASDSGIVYEGAFGWRRLAGGQPMTRDTVFRIASMVKLITTVAALQLVEQDKLSLDAPVPDIEPALGAPQVLEEFNSAGLPRIASRKAADFAAATPDPHRRLYLPALGCKGRSLFQGD